jgi:uncharacterized Zn-binding protein involved in type VI secretion
MPGKPAARVTDLTTHGSPLLPGPGSPNTLIGSLPAWRTIIDQHMCPAASITGADGVGFVVIGSPTVFINNQMACRIQDIVVEKPGLAMGPVNPIVMGCPTVLIGEAGIGGSPGAVVAGFAVVTLMSGDISVGSNVIISGTPEFQARALADLNVIAKTDTGKKILGALDRGTHKTTIVELDLATAQRNGALAGPTDRAGAKDPSKGSDTTISYNPNLRDKYTDQDGDKIDVPVQATLGHELIHAVHNANGTNERDRPDPKEMGSNQEESRTIGINDHEAEAMSENNLLKDLGAGYKRTDHDESVATE